ncbi:MAG: hypothetical protein ACFFC7_34165, partial [Candidatus Hermodarchaeota archaeon]
MPPNRCKYCTEELEKESVCCAECFRLYGHQCTELSNKDQYIIETTLYEFNYADLTKDHVLKEGLDKCPACEIRLP